MQAEMHLLTLLAVSTVIQMLIRGGRLMQLNSLFSLSNYLKIFYTHSLEINQ